MSDWLEDLKERPLFYPFFWAILLHLIFLAAAFFIPLYGTLTGDKNGEGLTKIHMLGVSTEPIFTSANPGPRPGQSGHPVQFTDTTHTAAAGVKDVPVETLVSSEPPLRQLSVEVSPKKMELQNGPVNDASDMNVILEKTEERRMKDDVRPRRRSTAEADAQSEKALAAAHQFNMGSLLKSLQQPLQGLSMGTPGNVGMDPEEGMPGFTPTSAGSGRGIGGFFDGVPDQAIGESKNDVVKYEPLDEFLDIQVATYEDPADSQKYYMIKILPKKGVNAFKVMPKEIIFTVDCSLSISQERLEEFKEGISYCLQHMNPGDVFNIVAFSDTAEFFMPESVPATPESIAQAEKFVSGLKSNNRTNVYQAVEDIVKTPAARKPSDLILITDGKPTHGIKDDRELLSAITAVNQKVRPIFAFSGGHRVNRYLLDFVAYQNRAWAQYIKSMYDIHTGMANFYNKIKDPIFLNLRYSFNNLNEAEVFPKSLPDFYRGAEFTLFGSYKDEDQFSMQLLGDVEGKTKQLVFTRSLAKAPKGTADIMKGYAFNKIYYLISRLNTEKNAAPLLAEINELSKRYGIQTPYSPELENK